MTLTVKCFLGHRHVLAGAVVAFGGACARLRAPSMPGAICQAYGRRGPAALMEVTRRKVHFELDVLNNLALFFKHFLHFSRCESADVISVHSSLSRFQPA